MPGVARQNFLQQFRRLRPGMMGVPGNLLLPSPRLSEVLSIWEMLEALEAETAEAIQTWQMLALDRLVEHVRQASAFWQPRLAGWNGDLASLPVTTRDEVRQQVATDGALPVPTGHGAIGPRSTSGSTGTPLESFASSWAGFLATLVFERHLLQAGVDIGACLVMAVARSVDDSQESWGGNLGELFETGPKRAIAARTRQVGELTALLKSHPGAILLGQPPVMVAAMQEALASSGPGSLPLSAVFSVGYSVEEHHRATVAAATGARVFDRYSCEELGPISLECPENPGVQHVAVANVVVEILRMDGSAADNGEAGRVVVTGLHSHATPFLRYEIGDLACKQMGCACGFRGPVLFDIVGRGGRLLELPDGTRRWMALRAREVLAIAPVREYRLIRRAPLAFDLEVVTGAPLTPAQQAGFEAWIRSMSSPEAEVRVLQLGAIDWGPGYKQRDFVDLVGG